MKIHSIDVDKEMHEGDLLKMDEKLYRVIECIQLKSGMFTVLLKVMESANEARFDYYTE